MVNDDDGEGAAGADEGDAGARAGVLLVCRANQIRSPIAELAFRRALHEAPELKWSVSSAGTRALDGQPMHPFARRAMAQPELVDDAFSSRRLSLHMVKEAAVVLTAERMQRAEVVALAPEALHRTFTLKQFARLVGAGVALPEQASRDDDVHCTIAWLVARARKARSLSQPGDDDVADPIGRPFSAFVESAQQIDAAVAAIVKAAATDPDGRTLRLSDHPS